MYTASLMHQAVSLGARGGKVCGIAGFLDSRPAATAEESRARAFAMTETLRHRGPDAGDAWADPHAGVGLGHRRLAIIELSRAGAQPMASASNRFVITFNGEIYNYRALRTELTALGYPFRGHSDTEVLLAGLEHWGLEKLLARVVGMFAFAAWDGAERTLVLARDRAGKKPLYYGWGAAGFLFGSELRALRRDPGFDASLDREALAAYVRSGFVPHPLSIHRGARKLPPGSWLRVRAEEPPWSPSPVAYWSAREEVEAAASDPHPGPYETAVDELESRLAEAVRDRLLASDVEVGALLSGGVDSTAVVALAQAGRTRPLRTFTIGFAEPRRDESAAAAETAAFLGTDHEGLVVTPEEARGLVPELPGIYDEPFADVSQIPTALVARLARRHVKVVLSGDGGDELFGGYAHHADCLRAWAGLRRWPRGLRRVAEGAARAAARGAWRLGRPRPAGDPARVSRVLRAASRLERRATGWSAPDPVELLARRFARGDPEAFVPGAPAPRAPLYDPAARARVGDPLLALRHFDFLGFLGDDVLVKVDRATMAVGLEARCPILDARVVAFAWRLPAAFLIDARGGKRILRDVAARHVPAAWLERPKRGFGAPVGDWLRGPLRPWAEDLLAEDRLRRAGLLDAAAVRTVWAQHRAGWRNHENLLWAFLMFEAWRDAQAART
jgi:asparagine synthase (glutamine-hydrolysing)